MMQGESEPPPNEMVRMQAAKGGVLPSPNAW